MTKKQNPNDIVIFDLGGVLGDFGGINTLHEIADLKDDNELWNKWLTSNSVREFESGRSTFDKFAIQITKEWEFTITADEFKSQFLSWVNGPLEGSLELLKSVKEKVQIGCLSNTNEPHWTNTISKWDFIELFDFPLLSFQIGLLKPDPEVFAHLTRVTNRNPQQIIFLDDNQMNVDAALEFGLRAYQVNAIEGCQRVLKEIGIL
ncbi:HAD family phosphatase [Acidithrix sp. C25]|uniref:HAD family hydrolase n=1 Tax=Acidithrix sp. C25 TaxID=1671482 RepID=UPI00191BAD40|nr:HAD family phosphatase [Acidithrix sp. C25]